MRLELKGITKTFGDRTVLDSVDLQVGDQELFALLGPSGSGKSTLLGIIAGLIRPDSGDVLFDGKSAPERPGHRKVGMVFQELALWPHMSVVKHLRFVAPETDPEELLRSLEIDHLLQARPGTLSGGEAQRLAIARALITSPEIFLLDEPLGPLDRRLKNRMLDLILAMHRRFKTTTLTVTHDYMEAFRIADRVGIIVDGRMIQVGTPSQVYERPSGVEAAELTGPVSFLSGQGEDGMITSKVGTHPSIEGGQGNAEVLIVLRPEDVDVTEDATGPGTVESCVSIGPAWDVVVLIGGERIGSRSLRSLAPGTKVGLKVPEKVWTVKK
jgi:ABC-type sugar transport system ATPase subunit